MSDRLINELKKHTLSSFFILPLIRLNPFKFGEINFINSWLDSSSRFIIVEVIDPFRVPLDVEGSHNSYFKAKRMHDDKYYYIYRIPMKWKNDVELYKSGKFSEMSEIAKDVIRSGSGLSYNRMNEEGNPVTDARLLALDKAKVLRQHWNNYLQAQIDPKQELLSIPTEKAFDLDALK